MKFINFGVRLNQPLTLQKQVVLSNYMGIVVFLFGLINVILLLVSGYHTRAISSLSTPLMGIMALGFNYFKQTLSSRIVLCILYPLVVIIGNLLIKIDLQHQIPLMSYIQPGIFLIIITLISQFLFDPYFEKKRYYGMIIISFLLFIGFDLLNNAFDVGIKKADFVWKGYSALAFTKIIMWLAFTGAITFLRKINAKHEQTLDSKNQELQVQSEEIQTRNEELIQQQEEILSQREYIEQKNDELTLSNRQIQDSVRAAEKLQIASQPTTSQMEQLVPNHFILFKPRDIVSGDFYWAHQEDKYNILIAADCTGHGVPGAFMTLVGTSLLREIIVLRNELSPDQILHQLHQGIFTFLKQENKGDNSGMDISIIVWKKEIGGWNMAFEGAKSSIIVVDKNREITEYKGSRSMIGGLTAKERQFSSKTIKVFNQDMIYLFTDGYKDQNDLSRKKFSNIKFSQLLKDISQQEMQSQKETLENTLTDYMAGTIQRDDILVIGCRVD